MVDLDQLEALDLMIWQGSSQRAAALVHANQSTICRRSRAALEVFELDLRRAGQRWRFSGDTALLDLERQVHQRARFLGLQALRLQVPCWSRRRALNQLPSGWLVNPGPGGSLCHDPVSLLRERVIDACLVTPTQLPADADDLWLVDLYRRPIELTVFDQGQGAHPTGGGGRSPEVSPRLVLMPFLPQSCLERSGDWFRALCGSLEDRDRPWESVAFLTPEMCALQTVPWWVEDAVQPYPYVERLVVLAEHATEPALQQLQEHLLVRFAGLAA